MFFAKKGDIQRLDNALNESFGNVRQDVEKLDQSIILTNQNLNNFYSWVYYMNNQNKALRSQNIALMMKIERINTQISDLKNNISNFNDQIGQVSYQTSRNSNQMAHMNLKLSHMDDRLNEVNKALSNVNMSREQIKGIIDYYYSFEDIIKQVRSMDALMDSFKERLDKASNIKDFDVASQLQYLAEIKELKARLDSIEKREPAPLQKPGNLREKLIQKITKKSRDYVRNLILSYIKKYERISALKLREMIVEEQGLASKSAFYRMLDEIDEFEEIESIKEGKERYFFYRMVKHT